MAMNIGADERKVTLAMAKKVFLVDDDPMYLMVLKQQFKDDSKYEVETYKTGEEALGQPEAPDLLIVDYYLNSDKADAINGIELMRRMREKAPHLPCVVLSSRADLSASSGSDALMGMLDFNRSGLVKEYEKGAFFYVMKNIAAPKKVKELAF
ncbi:MAG: response regulator, partial [Flavobacteriales bacterium]